MYVGYLGGQADFDLLLERQAPIGSGCGYVPRSVFQHRSGCLQRGDRFEVVPQRARRIPRPLVPPIMPRFPGGRGVWGGMGMTPSDWFVFVSMSRGCHAHCFPRRFPLGVWAGRPRTVCFALGPLSRCYGDPPQHRRTVRQRWLHTPRDRRHPGDALRELVRLLAAPWPRASAQDRRAVQAYHPGALQRLG